MNLAVLLVEAASYGLMLFVLAFAAVLTQGLMRWVYVSHAALALTIGYAAMFFAPRYGLALWLALLATAVAVALATWCADRWWYQRVGSAGINAQVGLGSGLLLVMFALLTALGAGASTSAPPSSSTAQALAAGLSLRALAELTFAGLATLALIVLVARTHWGARLRAVLDQASLARAVGIEPAAVTRHVLVLCATLACLCGGLYAGPAWDIAGSARLLVYLLLLASMIDVARSWRALLATLPFALVEVATNRFMPPALSLTVLLGLALLANWIATLVSARNATVMTHV